MSNIDQFGGPVSATLEADLRAFVRRNGIAAWLDVDDHYSAFVDRLMAERAAGRLPYDVRAFRGSHLALMLALEGIAGGVDKPPLVLHLPGFNEEAIRHTPLYELYAAGTRYRKALGTLVGEAAAGRVPVEQIEAFQNRPDLTLAEADRWLSALLAQEAGALAAQLRAMQPTAVIDDLLGGGFVAGRIAAGVQRRLSSPEPAEGVSKPAGPARIPSMVSTGPSSGSGGPSTDERGQRRLSSPEPAEGVSKPAGPARIPSSVEPVETIEGIRAVGGHDLAILWQQISVWTGMPASWPGTVLPSPAVPKAEDVAFTACSWALCVEYVDDLRRAPVSPLLVPAQTLPRPLVDLCRGIAAHLRSRHPRFYRRTADETESLLADEVQATRAADLGTIDTFRFEEETVLHAALEALAARRWDAASEWAAQRINAANGTDRKNDAGQTPPSFWLGQDPNRQAAWQLVQSAATLGAAIDRAGDHINAGDSLDEAMEFYVQKGAPVDQAHRRLEQRRIELLYPQVPEFETLRARLDGMRRIWQAWADGWARDFNGLCRTHGFLPAPASQQRTLFDEVVRPLAREPGTTAYFVVDALRFEMAQELYRELEGLPASTVHLKARLAELPTVTAVGMNALAPVAANGRLVPVPSDEGLEGKTGGKIVGFATGEFRVISPETRKRAMHDRVGGGTAPWLSLDEVINRDSLSLKRAVAQARLLVVHSQEIDSAGEKEAGPALFNLVLQKLRAAWRLLRDAGVRRFVFTADHGFLLLNEGSGSVQTHGRKVDPMRRYVLSPLAADHDGEVRVPLAALDYVTAGGAGVDVHLMLPETTAVFDTGRRTLGFVHGGNSLQERVIPVLTVVHRAAAGGTTLQYGIQAKALEGVAGMHCLQIKVEMVAQQMLDFGGSHQIELALRVPEAPEVQVELIQTRGKAALAGGAVQASVGETFELFFRLSGPHDARVVVELYHPGAVADVQPATPDARFAVSAARAAPDPRADAATTAPASAPPAADEGWLAHLPEGGVRRLFAHLAAHGTVTESEAIGMLGGPRQVRHFSINFEEYARKAPFDVRIDVVGGVKRYVREGRA